MFNNIDNDIYSDITLVKEKLIEKNRLTKILNEIELECEEQEKKLLMLTIKASENHEEAEAQNILSCGALLYKLLSNSREKEQWKKQPYIIYKMKIEECSSIVKRLRKQLALINSKLVLIENAEKEYKEMVTQRCQADNRETLAESNDGVNINESIAQTTISIKVIRELLIDGKSLLSLFQELIIYIEVIKGWNSGETAEGIAASAIKHSYLEEIRDKIIDIKEVINKFKRELKIIYFNEDIEEFTQKADKFSKEFFVDWLIDFKIEDTMIFLKGLEGRIEEIVNCLKREKNDLEANLTGLLKKYNEFLS